MQIRSGVEQAVYVLLILSLVPGRGMLAGEVISSRFGASPTYFRKLLRKLVRAGLAASVPGVNGGFRLARHPDEIRIYDIYVAVEGQQSLYSSNGVFADLVDDGEGPASCMLTQIMTEAESTWREVLQRETLESLKEQLWKDCPHTSAALEAWVLQTKVG